MSHTFVYCYTQDEAERISSLMKRGPWTPTLVFRQVVDESTIAVYHHKNEAEDVVHKTTLVTVPSGADGVYSRVY